MDERPPMDPMEFPCPSCGAHVQFDPATQQLVCTYCGQRTAIVKDGTPVRELDFLEHLHTLQAGASTQETLVVHCQACGAQTTLQPNVTASRCPFCDTPIVAQAQSVRQIKPQSLLPFRVTQKQASAAYTRWLHDLWFAPSRLRKLAQIEQRLRGLYIPFWTYDSRTFTTYTGQRGDDYWTTETYTAIENGKPVTRTRQVRRTRWWPISGQVRVDFDDVLVIASQSLPRKHAEALEPWDLRQLTAYQPQYQAGFTTQSYAVDLKQGFEMARQKMAPAIEAAIRRDIGGDHQRINSANTQYDDITFKHILLPLWIASYRYHDKVYRFLVNARTGEVQGERPWSWWKLTLFFLGCLVLLIVALAILLPALNWRHIDWGLSAIQAFHA